MMTTNFYGGNDYTKEYYHKEQSAVMKLLMEKQGYVKGAFYRDDMGDIDLVWGNEHYGLCHILKKRTEQLGEEKALRFISHLEENIKNGVMIRMPDKRFNIITHTTSIILAKGEDNHFILTAYVDRRNELRLENLQTIDDVNFIDKSEKECNKDSNILSSNQSQKPIIPQQPQSDCNDSNTPSKTKKKSKDDFNMEM